MSDNTIFSPTLGKEYCAYFLYMTIFAFMFLILTVIDIGYEVIKGKVSILSALLALTAPLILYLNNRILYSMCSNSLV